MDLVETPQLCVVGRIHCETDFEGSNCALGHTLNAPKEHVKRVAWH